MKPSFLSGTGFAVLMMLTLSSCASLEGRLTGAAATSGRVSAGIDIGALPVACETPVAHAPLVAGQGVVGVLKRERLQLDRANGVIGECAALHEDLRAHLLASQVVAPPLSGKLLAGGRR